MGVDIEGEVGGGCEVGEKPEGEDGGLACTLDMFREHQQVRLMLDNIHQAVQTEFTAEKAFEDLKTILDYYQEQPHLLDPHLEGLLQQLVTITRDRSLPPQVTLQAFKYLWLITKVRGHKAIFKKLPHEVKDLLPVLQLLEATDASVDFYQSYVLLLWLSIIVYMPFNMAAFDATTGTGEGVAGPTVVERVLTVIKTHLKSAQKSREMAAYLAARFITRPDLREKHLPLFIDHCFQVLENTPATEVAGVFHKLGSLRALGLIFKQGRREELAGCAGVVLRRLLASGVASAPDTPVRKLAVKLIQRVGLTFLRPKVASWRYQRGSRSLSINVQGGGGAAVAGAETGQASGHTTDEEEEVAEEVEEVIDCLLQGLKDQDTVVRWSAAKGVGRVTGRLPREFGDEVVGAILELFSTRESDKAWHGGCLALAELARRGLLLPERLPAVTPVLQRALVYDELRGQCSVGANIRDAACYLCWAFARAYHPDQMAPYVKQLATGLLIVALFDREIPCRRAGSAAFQEHVGRQGTFPHGIEILTAVDYYAVGNRSNAFLNLSVHVAKYPEYTQALIDHLIERKVNHWDSAIRELAAKALHNLTMVAPQYMSEKVLGGLVSGSTGATLVGRHGSILALAHILHALSKVAATQAVPLSTFISDDVLSGVVGIVGSLEERQLYRGLGGEYMRQATAVLIEKCALAVLPLHNNSILEVWHGLLEDCMVYAEENIRAAALEAIAPLWATYYQPDGEKKLQWRDALITRYTKALTTDKEIQSLGFAAALGCLPRSLACGKFDQVLPALLSATEIRPETASWAQTRKQAITSTLALTTTLGIKKGGKGNESVCERNLATIYQALLAALDDYTMDRRGDIGAWVREAALTALSTITVAVVKEDASLLSKEIVEEMMSRICQQAVERIDRTRKVAGSTFTTLLYSSPRLPHIPCLEAVEKIFPRDVCESINWASERSTFHLFVQLLDLPPYRTRVLLGVLYSAGGISANLSRYTSEALHGYLNARVDKPELLHCFWETILKLFADHQKVDRITLPLIKTLGDLLSSSAVLDTILEGDDTATGQLISLLRKESARCSDYHKLAAVITVLCELLRLATPTTTKAVLTQLSLFLGYQYPKVRAVTATSLLTALQDYSDQDIVPEESVEEVTNILEETEWMNNLEEARNQRNRICVLAGISPPQPKKK